MEIILITAMTPNRVIGRNNQIPWYLPGEQKRFRATTWGHTIIMGRKTHESIGRPLPGRRNIIVTRNPKFRANGCEVVLSLAMAYTLCEREKRIFNIGGEQLYRMGIKDADTLIITYLQEDVEGDAFFPDFSDKEFKMVKSENILAPIPYSILTYSRVKT